MDSFEPLVQGQTSATGSRIDSIVKNMKRGHYYVPDFQRDESQWDRVKQSLLIESIINGLTVPPVMLCPSEKDPNKREIIDGQQRLRTIEDFIDGKFKLADEDDADYSENVAPHIAGKSFADLPAILRERIEDYELNIITLPSGMTRGLRLEVFRRINEGGVPLSAQDLRLSQFGNSARVTFVRLAGVFDPSREGSQRMIIAAKNTHRLAYPWQDHSAWLTWWDGSLLAGGQNPSQMFLWYLIASSTVAVETLTASPGAQKAAGVICDGSTTSLLDLYCAQLQHEDTTATAARLLPDLPKMQSLFTEFEKWFNAIKKSYVPSLNTNSATKIAFVLSRLPEIFSSPNEPTDRQWNKIQILLNDGPTKVLAALGQTYPQTRGKWKGQARQMLAVRDLCDLIKTTI
jgi:hypothetical protein